MVELVRQAAQRGERVLVCAPSNVAVDNVVAKLVAKGPSGGKERKRLRVVRFGHPARMVDEVLAHGLHAVDGQRVRPPRHLQRGARLNLTPARH